MERFSLKDKVAIVTGASRGIGEAIAMAFSEAGARLVLSSRRMENVGPVAEKINAAGGRAIAVAAHAGHPEEVSKLVATAIDTFGTVDIAVNNAGTSIHFGPVITADEAVWDKTFQTNLKGYFFLCKEVAPVMRKQSRGKIINVASAAGMVPFPGLGVYGAIKAGIIMLTKYLAVELGPYGIQVNAIAPGTVKTRLMDTAWQISSAVGGDTRRADGAGNAVATRRRDGRHSWSGPLPRFARERLHFGSRARGGRRILYRRGRDACAEGAREARRGLRNHGKGRRAYLPSCSARGRHKMIDLRRTLRSLAVVAACTIFIVAGLALMACSDEGSGGRRR